jgi:hypothetical protein
LKAEQWVSVASQERSVSGADTAAPNSPIPNSCGFRWLTTPFLPNNHRSEPQAGVSRNLRRKRPGLQHQREGNRMKIADTVWQWFAELQLFRGNDGKARARRRWGRTTTGSDSFIAPARLKTSDYKKSLHMVKFLVFLLLPQESPLVHTFFTGEQIFPVAAQNNMAESEFSEHVASF